MCWYWCYRLVCDSQGFAIQRLKSPELTYPVQDKYFAVLQIECLNQNSKFKCFAALQIEGEFPHILGIKESLIKYVFEPAAANKAATLAAVKEMRGR